MVDLPNGDAPAPEATEKPKLQLSVHVARDTWTAHVASNQDPVVMTVADLSAFITTVLRNLRPPEEQSRIVLPGRGRN